MFVLKKPTGRINSRDCRVREDECADWGAVWLAARESKARTSTTAAPSTQSQIESLQARLLEQDARIAELKAQALRARETIDTLTRQKIGLEIDAHWHKSDLERAEKYHAMDLAREKRFHEAELAMNASWHKSDMASAQKFFDDSLQTDRKQAAIEFDQHKHTLNAFASYLGRPPPEVLAVELPPPSLDKVLDASLVVTHPLTSVQLVAESCLRGCGDVLPLITAFLLKMPLEPLDVAVTRGAVHMTRWLLANGAAPTTLTAHAAVSGGNLDIVKAVFSSIDSVEPKHELFQELPINKSEPIALWLLQTYPAQMAKELVRLSSREKAPSRCQWAWYAERVKQQWQWEQDLENQCLSRKRKRLERPTPTP